MICYCGVAVATLAAEVALVSSICSRVGHPQAYLKLADFERHSSMDQIDQKCCCLRPHEIDPIRSFKTRWAMW